MMGFDHTEVKDATVQESQNGQSEGHPATIQLEVPLARTQQVVRTRCEGVSADDLVSLRKSKAWISRLGGAEIIIGVSSVILQIFPVAVVADSRRNRAWQYSEYDDRYAALTYVSPGILSGVLAIVTGILGVCMKAGYSRCMHYAMMFFTIGTAAIAFPTVCVSGTSAGLTLNMSLIVIHAFLAVLNFALACIAIVHSMLCCSRAGMSQNLGSYQVLANASYANHAPADQYPVVSNIFQRHPLLYMQAPIGHTFPMYAQQHQLTHQGHPMPCHYVPQPIGRTQLISNYPPPQAISSTPVGYNYPPTEMTQPPTYASLVSHGLSI